MEKRELKHNRSALALQRWSRLPGSVPRLERVTVEFFVISFEHVIETGKHAENPLVRMLRVVFPAQDAQRGLRYAVGFVAIAVVVKKSVELHEGFFTHDSLPNVWYVNTKRLPASRLGLT